MQMMELKGMVRGMALAGKADVEIDKMMEDYLDKHFQSEEGRKEIADSPNFKMSHKEAVDAVMGYTRAMKTDVAKELKAKGVKK